MEEQLSDWIQDYLEQQEDFNLLTDEDKFKMYHVYKTVLIAVSKCLEFDNVFPILIASNEASKQVILGALNDLASTIPEAKKITVSLIN